MTRFALTAVLALMPVSAIAETQLERLERLSEEMNQVMPIMMANEIEAQGGDATALRDVADNLPDWDGEMRAAGECIIDRYTAEAGDAEVAAMFDRMEELVDGMADMQMTEFAESDLANDMLPEGVTLEESAAITQECGMMDLQMKAMQESGLVEAMMAAGATVGN